MVFGYDEYIRQVQDLLKEDERQCWRPYESWTPDQLQNSPEDQP